MKKREKIHGLDSLEKEIYRLKLQAVEQKKELEKNMEYLHDHGYSMLVNSFFRSKKTKAEARMKAEGGFPGSGKLKNMVNRVTDRLADHAADRIATLLEKIFRKERK